MNVQKLADWYAKMGESTLTVGLYTDGSILYVQKSSETTEKIRTLLKAAKVSAEAMSSDGSTTVFVMKTIPAALDEINALFDLTYTDNTDKDCDKIELWVAYVEKIDLDKAGPVFVKPLVQE